METARLQQSIQQGFYQDQLALKESPAMTATEVNVRWEMMQRLLGPTLGRLKTDLLDPLIQRTFNILYRANLLAPLPEELAGADLDIEYNGPLPRAQQANTAMAIEQWIRGVAELAQINPQALDIVDWDKAMREIAKLRGVPAKAVASEEDVARGRAEKQQQQDAMMTIQGAQGAGDAMKAIGEGMQAIEGPEAANA
jgi:hypothetical protein